MAGDLLFREPTRYDGTFVDTVPLVQRPKWLIWTGIVVLCLVVLGFAAARSPQTASFQVTTRVRNAPAVNEAKRHHRVTHRGSSYMPAAAPSVVPSRQQALNSDSRNPAPLTEGVAVNPSEKNPKSAQEEPAELLTPASPPWALLLLAVGGAWSLYKGASLRKQARAARVAMFAIEGKDEAEAKVDLDQWEATAQKPVFPVVPELLQSMDANPPPENYSPKADLFSAIGIGSLASITLGIIDYPWVAAHQTQALTIVFILGYIGIILEEELAFNKCGVSLLMATSLWTIRAESLGGDATTAAILESLSDVSEILFFLLGAMAIVEIVDAHKGFKLITGAIKTSSKTTMLVIVATITFFLSAVLDNLTSTIVMVSLLKKLVPADPEYRKLLGAMVVIAANAGGAWTPIGDVTTTMLWIDGQITTAPTMSALFLPSLASLAVPVGLMAWLSDDVKGSLTPYEAKEDPMAPRGKLVLGAGLTALLSVPVYKTVTGLPPFLGMVAGLGALWVLTDVIHYGEDDRDGLKVPEALTRIDTQGILFFLGILLSVGCLQEAGLLTQLANILNDNIDSPELIAGTIGAASAVIDNVPLVAATQGMYDIADVAQDDKLWQLIAYCAGTGGSMLIIGSAAGVAFMGMEKAEFGWYVKKVTPWAVAGYLAGMAVYIGQDYVTALF